MEIESTEQMFDDFDIASHYTDNEKSVLSRSLVLILEATQNGCENVSSATMMNFFATSCLEQCVRCHTDGIYTFVNSHWSRGELSIPQAVIHHFERVVDSVSIFFYHLAMVQCGRDSEQIVAVFKLLIESGQFFTTCNSSSIEMKNKRRKKYGLACTKKFFEATHWALYIAEQVNTLKKKKLK